MDFATASMRAWSRSEEHTSELQSLRRISYAVFCLKKKNKKTYSGGRMPRELIERWLALFPDSDFTNAYGLTEISSTIALLDPRAHRAALASTDPAVRARLGSVGRALPTVEIEIRDEQGRPLPAG